MNVLVVGKGGREHALVKALVESNSCPKVFALPGNDGMAEMATLIPVADTKAETIYREVLKYKIDLVIVGPEAELAAGVASVLREKNIPVVGPGHDGAELEASKILSKEFMVRAGVPTAKFSVVTSVEDVVKEMESYQPPYVLKADGLCAGKGVFICETPQDLKRAAIELFDDKVFGSAGAQALLEEFKHGYEISFLVLTNGEKFEPLPLCQDHKRLLENDLGPNTGGMGVIGPIQLDLELYQQIIDQIVSPSIEQLKKEKLEYLGVLYIGVMVSQDGLYALEYNVRLGDPEAQIILPLLDGNWVDTFSSLASGELKPLKWKNQFATCVVMAAENYPVNPVKGSIIEGDISSSTESSYFIHAGTKKNQGQWTTDGGRVLNAIGLGASLKESRDNAYAQAQQVGWVGMQLRHDIGSKFL